ncbi:hydroxylamine reductase [Azospirillum brasilense]|uniref:hydroxylamine reductase n=1 Tax=Azospirillum brasilense TaxID=192 RepID=UPI00190E3894|nr:hydroxylamine reductase [Azospirillum brasilense]MBK3733759.1 hydroxylamine reductase [Azospirillum brasilense]
MFCYQCEQTTRGTACTVQGACGKTPDTAALQDLLVHAAQAISQYAHRLGKMGIHRNDADAFVLDALFTTVTNVNFDPARLETLLRSAAALRDELRALHAERCPGTLDGPAAWAPAADLEGLIAQGREVSIDRRIAAHGPDLAGLQELVLYGLKGAAAYACHARLLGREDPGVYAFMTEALTALAEDAPTVEGLLELSLRTGAMSVSVLALLDGANTGTYGHPVPTPVRMGHVRGKAILVSGHDLKDLEELLKQTAGTGINVYTHGEMLPAHGYPALKAHPHLAGHYGGAWQRQRGEFDAFPGAILMTTNCIQQPAPGYADRIFTSGLVAWPGVTHIAGHDYTPVIAAALAAEGFGDESPERHHTVGFHHDAVLGVAGPVVEAVKSGAIRHFTLIGGCDGAESARSYYTDMAAALPRDSVVLTLGCGKFRVIDQDLGTVAGLPRLLDMGQCNDAYSAVKVAQALADAFGVGVNELPLSLVISWYEQKAVAVLLALLHLGVKNIRLGPKLPAFVTPAVLKVLVDAYNIMPIGTVEDDLKAMGLAA